MNFLKAVSKIARPLVIGLWMMGAVISLALGIPFDELAEEYRVSF